MGGRFRATRVAPAGCTFDDVVDATVFLVDPEAAFERIRTIVSPNIAATHRIRR